MPGLLPVRVSLEESFESPSSLWTVPLQVPTGLTEEIVEYRAYRDCKKEMLARMKAERKSWFG